MTQRESSSPQGPTIDHPQVSPGSRVTVEEVTTQLTVAAAAPGVRIDPVRPDDVHDLHALVGRNAEHLAADHGDLVEYRSTSSRCRTSVLDVST